LAEGAAGTLSWDRAGGSVAKIDFRTFATVFTFTYEGANAKSVEERVPLARVAAGFGGTRAYFRCPGTGCGRRVMVLYFARCLFRCRQCHGLAYETQREDARRRAGRRADKSRARLGYQAWRPFQLAPMERPKGMWMRRSWDLYGRVLVADYDASKAFEAGLQSLADRPRSAGCTPRAMAASLTTSIGCFDLTKTLCHPLARDKNPAAANVGVLSQPAQGLATF
jgi:hypothetical protein